MTIPAIGWPLAVWFWITMLVLELPPGQAEAQTKKSSVYCPNESVENAGPAGGRPGARLLETAVKLSISVTPATL